MSNSVLFVLMIVLVLAGVSAGAGEDSLTDEQKAGVQANIDRATAALGDKMNIGGTCHIQIRAHNHDIFSMEPVDTFLYIGLLPPNLGGGRRKVAVPIIKAEVNSTKKLQQARASTIAQI